MELSREQRAAIEHRGGHAWILAGPGSGKTTVLAHRIRHLLQGDHVSADSEATAGHARDGEARHKEATEGEAGAREARHKEATEGEAGAGDVREQGAATPEVLALTFTNKAVAELRHRVGDDPRVRVRTFHALAKHILADTLGACIVASHHPAGDTGLLRAALACTWPRARPTCRAAFEAAMPGRDPACLDERARAIEADPAPVWLGYQKALADGEVEPRHLSRRGAIPSWFRPWAEAAWEDWLLAKESTGTFHLDELVPWATRAVAHGAWQQPLRSVLVDELQDTSPDQWRLLVALAARAPLFAVGDPRQAIYGFRGADRRNALSFPQHFADATRYELAVNHRSTRAIIDFANQLAGSRIAAASGASEGEAVTMHRVPVVGAKDGSVPADEHLDAILGGTLEVLHDALQHHTPQDILVLGRDNRRLDALAHHMQRRSIPMQRLTGDSDAGDGVRLATVHAAKGLQAPMVVIIGFDSRGFSDAGKTPEERLETQRSLFVACTRAQERLVLVAAEHPRIRGPAGLEVDAAPWRTSRAAGALNHPRVAQQAHGRR